MKKINLTLMLVVLLAASLVSAEEGCYIYKESALYCFDLGREDALGDCSIYGGCMFEKIFFEGKSCSNLDMFLECEEILCKSTCDYETRGNCWAGEVPAGEEQVWCSSGCCRFEYYKEEFCEFKKNKWLCEIEAKNKDIKQFKFEAMDEKECREICSKALILGEKITEGLVMEEVSEGVPLSRPLSTEKPVILSSPPAIETIEEGKGISWSWIFLFLFLLSIVFYLLYQKYKPREEVLVKLKAEKKPRFFFRRKAIEKREERIKKLREEREQKRKEKERKELFGLFGLGGVNERKLSYVDLLGKAAKVHELKDRRRIREEDIFRKVERLFKEKEKKKLIEEEAKNIFEKLKKIIEKKK